MCMKCKEQHQWYNGEDQSLEIVANFEREQWGTPEGKRKELLRRYACMQTAVTCITMDLAFHLESCKLQNWASTSKCKVLLQIHICSLRNDIAGGKWISIHLKKSLPLSISPAGDLDRPKGYQKSCTYYLFPGCSFGYFLELPPGQIVVFYQTSALPFMKYKFLWFIISNYDIVLSWTCVVMRGFQAGTVVLI